MAFIRRCAMQHVEGNQKDDGAEERGEATMLSKDKTRIEWVSMSLRVFRVARRTHDLYFLQDRAAITCCGGELREAAKKEAATGMVGKASTGSDTRLVNLPWQFNEDVYKPEREYRERRQKHFRFRPESNRSIGHTFIFRQLWFCRSSEIIAKYRRKAITFSNL